MEVYNGVKSSTQPVTDNYIHGYPYLVLAAIPLLTTCCILAISDAHFTKQVCVCHYNVQKYTCLVQ